MCYGQRNLQFHEEEIAETGIMFVRKDGTVLWFRDSKARRITSISDEILEAQVDPKIREGWNKVRPSDLILLNS